MIQNDGGNMLWDLIKEDKILTISIVIVGIIWFLVFIRNFWTVRKSTGDFEKTYDHILSADEFKVKGKYEQ
ncbi:MAG: hypothetical protein WC254_04970 [Candidatus Woesearchaeota archaeon]|jgi:TM2 domain-containing membrane protein YozV